MIRAIEKTESAATAMMRWYFNFHPTYRGTGGWITRIAADWRAVDVTLPLNMQTRNYVGTIYGGSIYASIDPFYMIMFMKNLGKEYVVWDKAANIRFLKPGRSKLFARFRINDNHLNEVRDELRQRRTFEQSYIVELADADGVIHAEIEKLLYFRRKGEHHVEELTSHAG